MWIGGCTFFPLALLSTSLGWQVLCRIDYLRYAPTFFVLWRAENGADDTFDSEGMRAFRVLAERVQFGTPAHARPIIERAISHLSAPRTSREHTWVYLLTSADNAGMLAPDQLERALRIVLQDRLRFRPRVALSDSLVCEDVMDWSRSPWGSVYMSRQMEVVPEDGTPVRADQFFRPGGERYDLLGAAIFNPTNFLFPKALTERMGPGTHHVEIRYERSIAHHSGTVVLRDRFPFDVLILPPGVPSVTLIDRRMPEADLQAVFRDSSIFASGNPVTIDLHALNLPLDVAYRAELILQEHQTVGFIGDWGMPAPAVLGRHYPRRQVSLGNGALGRERDSQWIRQIDVGEFALGQGFTIVLTPDPMAAAQTADIFEIAGNEITLSPPVTWRE